MKVVDALPLVSDEDRARIIAAPKTADAHRQIMASLPAMNAVQVGGTASTTALPRELSVVAWNMERCLFPEASADQIRDKAPDIVLLSEVDHGMSRTKQRHTSEVMAQALGMTYAFGVEFHELNLCGPTEHEFCDDDFNERGWHGNAILSSVPFDKVTMIRLDDHGHWFIGEFGEPRVGGRNAIAAVVSSDAGPLCICSTHLESNSEQGHRAKQFDLLMDRLDSFAPDMPIIIGGDLNTGNHMPPDFDWRKETLFDQAERRGYTWDNTEDGYTTRPSLITRNPTRKMKLDWFATRGFDGQEKSVISSLAPDGTPLSDHDAVWCKIRTQG